MDVWVGNPSANTANVANTWVNDPYMLPDFCYSVMANISLGMDLLLKKWH